MGGADVWPRGQTSFGNVVQPYHDLANLWRVWLPPEAEATFKKGKQTCIALLCIHNMITCIVAAIVKTLTTSNSGQKFHKSYQC